LDARIDDEIAFVGDLDEVLEDLSLIVAALEELAAASVRTSRYSVAYTDLPELFAGDILLDTEMAPQQRPGRRRSRG
jgi:hypothetical protein